MRVQAELDVSDCAWKRGARITNDNGVLHCGTPLRHNALNLPDGNFRPSCYGCSIEGDNLVCLDCLDSKKGRHTSSIPMAGCDNIGNNQGQLVCEKPSLAEPSQRKENVMGRTGDVESVAPDSDKIADSVPKDRGVAKEEL